MIETKNHSLEKQNALDSLARDRSIDLAPQCPCEPTDLLCFSHLRWDFVYQRPNHLMSRFARHRRVYYIEEPICSDIQEPMLHVSEREDQLRIVVPHLPRNLDRASAVSVQQLLLNEFLEDHNIVDPTLWYYTPMALPLSDHLPRRLVIYDCMDELSQFKDAPPELIENEARLMSSAHAVFTGGHSLFEAKRHAHRNIHPFPSSIDRAHFAKARAKIEDPSDQAPIPRLRLGFFGVIDERLDIELLDGLAAQRPDWHIVMIGPVAKIDPSHLPRRSNIHYLGKKDYADLPHYIAGWDVAIMPFARNASTQYISPTKTPEYLAAGKPVVSTSIRDVIRPYGQENLAKIADTVPDFILACEQALLERRDEADWHRRVDSFLANSSWDQTWQRMAGIESACRQESALTVTTYA